MPKQLTRENYDSIRDHIFDCIHKNGQNLKLDFPNVLRTAINAKIWKQFNHFDGKPFTNLVEWLHYQFPNGPSLGHGQHAITYEDALKLTEGAEDVHCILLENAPKGKRGPKHHNELNASTHLILNRNGRNTRTMLSIRLFEQKPEFYEAYMRGEYASITAAAIAAGLIRNDATVRRAKSSYRKMTAKQREEFDAWAKNFRSQEKKNKS